MSNYNDYKIQLSALLDANASGDLQKQANAIKDLSITVSKLNLNKSAIEHLKTQLAQNGIDINLVLGNTDKVKNETKQVGQQIGQALGNQIEKDIKKGIDTASSSLKSFSDLQSRLVNNTNLFNLNDFEKQFDGIKKIYSEFGQVKITDALFDDGQLQKFKVNIEQVNGDLKETRSFIMSLNDTEDHFVFSGLVKGSESIVQHLDKSKNAINQTGDAINDLKHKLQADKLKLSIGDSGDTTKQITLVENGFVKLGLSAQEVHDKMLPVNNELSKLNTIMSNNGSNEEIVNQFSRLKIAVDEAKNNLTILRSEYSLLTTDDKLLTGKFDFDISNINNQLSRFGELSGEAFLTAKSSALELQQIYNELKLIDGDDSKKVAKEKEYQKQLEKTKNLLKELKLDKNNEILTPNDSGRIKLINNLTNFLSKNTAITKENRKVVEQWIATLSSSDDILRGTVNNIKLELSTLETQMRQTGELGYSWSDKLKNAWEKFGGWAIATGAFTLMTSNFRKSINEIKELDNILTGISKTSDMTSRQLQELGMSAYDNASKFGLSANDYLLAVQEMSRSGFYGDIGSAMAESSLLAAAAGDLTADLANDYVIATNAAYKFAGNAEKINEVLDGQNSITNRNSVAMKDMAEAMSNAGNVASAFNIGIEDFSAMVGTIEAVTKAGGSEVGNSLKTILANLQNVTSDKIVTTLDNANASMTKFVNGAEKLRNPIEIIRDLAKTFNELEKDDPLRSEILLNIGGKHQMAKLSALLSNMEMFDKMLADYSNGAGSAMEEAEKSATNLTGSLNELKNTWTNIINNIVTSDSLISIVNTFNGILSVINNITKSLGAFGTISLVTSIGLSTKDLGLFKKVNNEIQFMGTNVFKLKTSMNDVKFAINAYKQGLDNLTSSDKARAQAIVKSNSSLKDYITNMKASTTATNASSASTNVASGSLTGYIAKLALAKTGTVLLKAASMAFNIGLSLVTTTLISGISHLITYGKKATETAAEISRANEEQRKSSEDLVDQYKTLSKSLDNQNLTTEEVRVIKEKLLEIQASLIESFGKEAESLDLLNGKYDENIEKIRQMTQEQALFNLSETRKEYDKASKKASKSDVYDLDFAFNIPSDGLSANHNKVLDYMSKYSEKITLVKDDLTGLTSVYAKLTKLEAPDFLKQFYADIATEANNLDIDITPFLNSISKQLKVASKQLSEDQRDLIKNTVPNIIASDKNLSERFSEGEDAVYNLNQALKSREGVEEAQSNYDAIKQSTTNFVNITNAQSQEVKSAFDNMFDGINTNAQKSYEVSKRLSNDDSLQKYIDKIKEMNLDNLDLQSVDLDSKSHPYALLAQELDITSESASLLRTELIELNAVSNNSGNDVAGDIEEKAALAIKENEVLQKRLDGYSSTVSNLTGALTKLKEGNLTPQEVLNLAFSFGNLKEHIDMSAVGYGNLEEGIRVLVGTITNDLISALEASNDPSLMGFTEMIKSVKQAALDGVDGTNKLGKSVKQLTTDIKGLSELANTLKPLETAMGKLREGKPVDISDLTSIQKAFQNIEGIDHFIDKLGVAKKLTPELKGEFDSLVTTFIYSSGVLNGLTNENKDLIVAQLELMGVTVESEVVTKILADANLILEQTGRDVVDMTIQEIIELLNLASTSEELASALLNAANAKLDLNSVTIDTSGDINALEQLILKAKDAATAMSLLQSWKNGAAKGGISFEEYLVSNGYKNSWEKSLTGASNQVKLSANKINYNPSSNNSGKSKEKKSKEKKEAKGKEPKYTEFDWIEVKLKRIQEAIDRSKKKAETFINYLKKNKQLKDVEKLTNKEITANKDALSFYNKKLKASTLDNSLKKLVKNGKISIGKYDENTTKKIQDYQKWYEAAQNTKDKLKELKEELKEIGQLKLSNISEYFNIRTGYVESKISKRQSLISMRESQGKKERLNDIKYIEQLQKDEITYLEKAKKAYEKEFNKQVTNGLIKKYSHAWYEGKKDINEYTQSLYDLKGQLAETGKEIEKFPFIAQDKKREKYDKKLSEIDNILDLYDDEDIEKIALQQAGLSQAVKKAELTRKQLNKLEKEYAKNNISKSVYEEQKDKLQEELNSNAKAIKGYNDGIISSMKARYDEELKLAKKSLDDKLKLLEKEKKEKLDALKDELDAYKKIIDEQKKAIQDKQKEDKYQKEIAKYAEDISKLESRIERLKLAEQSGDQTARKERLEAEENLSKLKEELDEKQKDKEIENAVDALDEEYKKFEEVNKKETDKIEKQYEIEKELAQEKYDFLENKIEKLYENERQLIVEAAQLTQDEFSKVFDAINTQLKSYGLEISPELSGVVGTTQSDVRGQAKSSDIEKILGKKDEKNKLQNMSSLSGLNKYIASAGYKTITKAQMVELAKSLGLDDITKTSQVGTNDEGRKNKNRILAALKNARFAKGGTVTGGMTLPEMVKYSGEDGIAFVSKGEEILNPFHASIFEDFVKQLDVMHKTGSSINTNHSPTVVVNLPANSVIDNSAVNNWRSCVDEISNAVSKQILNGSKLK